MNASADSEVISLAALAAGDEFVVVRTLALDPAPTGIHHFTPGRRWRCSYIGTAVMLLVSHTGKTIRIPVDLARGVEVQRTRVRGR